MPVALQRWLMCASAGVSNQLAVGLLGHSHWMLHVDSGPQEVMALDTCSKLLDGAFLPNSEFAEHQTVCNLPCFSAGSTEVAAAAAAADAPAPMDVDGVDQSAAGPGEAPAAAAAAGLGHDGAAEAGAPDADAAVAEAGEGGPGSAGRKRKAAGAADGAPLEAAAEVGRGSVAGSPAASVEAAAVKQDEGQLLVRAWLAAMSHASSWPPLRHGSMLCVRSAVLSCTLDAV